MKNKKIIYTLIGIISCTFSLMNPFLIERVPSPLTPPKNKPAKKIVAKKIPEEKVKLKQGIIKKNLVLKELTFDELPGWDRAHIKKSLSAFKLSCEQFLKQKPSHSVGSQYIQLKAKDWYPACRAALDSRLTEDKARDYFETWFHPIELKERNTAKGLFTGYYVPKVEGRLRQTGQFNTPIYGLPSHKNAKLTRSEIDRGGLKNKAPVLAWIKSPVDRLSLELEGSGVVQLPNGKNLYLGYAGENGSPHKSLSRILIDKGVMTRDNASKNAIARYAEQHPEKLKQFLHQNESFVYFENLKKPMALGAQGMALTPGYSLAVDKRWVPLGVPLWLNTSKPNQANHEKPLQRLMVAQDTGGAIKGFMRGDVYWGSGKIAAFLGEHMKNKGHYWLLLPKNVFKTV